MNDTQCIAFLRWALPRLGMRWAGFRRVRRQVCRRARRRASELGLSDLNAYRTYLEAHAEEWSVLDRLTPITISRFYRDRGIFELLAADVLPALAEEAEVRGAGRLEAWSAGCASGEEPYTVAIIWEQLLSRRYPSLSIGILATDVHAAMLARARHACFTAASVTDLPEELRAAAFERQGGCYCVRARFRQPVSVLSHDIRTGPPDGPFDLVMCRNLAFTYFDAGLQRKVSASLAGSVRPGGALVIGAHERLPTGIADLEPWKGTRCVYRRLSSQAET